MSFRPVADGIVAVLAYDLPTSVIPVEPQVVRAWGQSFDGLEAIAAQNVRADRAWDPIERETLDSGVVVHRLTGDSFFVSAQALWLKRFPQRRPRRGNLCVDSESPSYPIQRRDRWSRVRGDANARACRDQTV